MNLVRTAAVTALLLAAGAVSTARAEDAKPQTTEVTVCDSLITLRQLMADAPDQTAAKSHMTEHPGCREVSRKDLGEIERRTMLGGAPYECFKLGSGPCVWVLP